MALTQACPLLWLPVGGVLFFCRLMPFQSFERLSMLWKLGFFLRLFQIVTILTPSFSLFSNDSLFLLSLSPSSASSPPSPSLSGYIFWHLVCLPGKRQLPEKEKAPSLLLGCAGTSERDNGPCSLGKGNACHYPSLNNGQVQGSRGRYWNLWSH